MFILKFEFVQSKQNKSDHLTTNASVEIYEAQVGNNVVNEGEMIGELCCVSLSGKMSAL